MSIKSLDLAWITTNDIKGARSFFVDKLGLVLTESNEEMGWMELKGPDGGATLGVAQHHKSEDPYAERLDEHKPGANAVFAITVTNIEKMKTLLEGKGIKFAGDIMEVPGHVKLATFFDPDNNMFQLVEHIGS